MTATPLRPRPLAPAPTPGPRWARDTIAFYLRHPWVLQVSQARPVLGPHEYAGPDTLVRCLYGTGLDAGVLRRLVGTLFHFVRGAAQTVADARDAASGRPDEEWWYARSAALVELVPDVADRYPELSRMEREPAPPEPSGDDSMPYPEREARETFTAELGVLLDGVGAAVRRGRGVNSPWPLGSPAVPAAAAGARTLTQEKAEQPHHEHDGRYPPEQIERESGTEEHQDDQQDQ